MLSLCYRRFTAWPRFIYDYLLSWFPGAQGIIFLESSLARICETVFKNHSALYSALGMIEYSLPIVAIFALELA
ncbi:hypothetical protein CW304_08235 [Bacillus sp. UFRGS-B20]|nr:hypothetical protein CW304_08235 [Bacillus sp. UFRGS-B20]